MSAASSPAARRPSWKRARRASSSESGTIGVESCIVILTNGVIRTMDPSLPTAAALAIAGDRVAGGVGTHETALASPETIDLGGLTGLPGFTDSHVHFAQWSLAQRQVRLEGTKSLDEAVARVAEAAKD